MLARRLSAIHRLAAILALTGCVSSVSLAQGPSSYSGISDSRNSVPDAPMPSAPAISPAVELPSTAVGPHKFWDLPNCALFVAAAALNGADFAVTHANLQNGGRELNPVVRIFGRSAPGLAVTFGGETAGVMGFAYFLHKRGHHKLERLISMANIGASAGAMGYGLTHRR